MTAVNKSVCTKDCTPIHVSDTCVPSTQKYTEHLVLLHESAVTEKRNERQSYCYYMVDSCDSRILFYTNINTTLALL